MSWLNKSLSQLTDVTSSISKFTEDVLAAEPPTQGGEDETGDDGQLAAYRRQLDYYKAELEKAMNGNSNSIEVKIEIDDLKRKLESKTLQNDELQLQVGNINEELEDTINELTKVSKRNAHLSKTNLTFESKNKELRSENDSLQKSLEEIDQVHEDEIGELIKQRDDLKNHINRLQLELPSDEGPEKLPSDGAQNVNALIAKNETLKNEIESLKAELTNRESSTSGSRESSRPGSPGLNATATIPANIKQKMAKIQKTLKAKIEDLEVKLSKSESEKDEFKITNENFEKQIIDLHDQISNLTEKIATHNDQIATQNDKISNQTEQIHSQTKQIQSQTEQIQSQSEQIQKLNENVSDSSANEQLITDNDNLSSKISELNDEMSKIKSELSDKNRIVAEQESIMLEFATKIEEKEKELIGQLGKSNETISNQTDEITQWKVKTGLLSDELESYRSKNKLECEKLEAEKLNLTTKLKQMVDCLKIAEGKQAAAEGHVEKLNKENVQIQSDWEDDQRQNEREIQNLESIISQLQNDNRELEKSSKTTEGSPEDTPESEVEAQLKTELENSRRGIEEAKQTIENLESEVEENKSATAEVEVRLKTELEALEKLQKQLNEKDSVILELKNQSQEAIEDQQKIGHEENRLKHENIQLVDRLQNIEEDLKTIERSRDDALQEVRDLEKVLSSNESERKELEEKLEVLENEILKSKTMKQEIERDLEATKSELIKARDRLKTKEEELKASKSADNLQDDQKMAEELENLKSQNEEYEVENEELLSEIKNLKAEKEKLKSDEANMKNNLEELEDLKKTLDEYEEKDQESSLTLQRYIENYNAEIEALKSELEESNLQAITDVEKKNEEVEILSVQLTEINESLEKTQETLFEKLEEIEELKKLKETTDTASATITEDHNDSQETKDKIVQLEKTIEDQAHCISQHEAQINLLKDRNQKLSEEIKTIIDTQEDEVSLKKPIDDVTYASQESNPDFENLRNRLQESESKLKTALDQIEDLEEDASAAQDIFNQLKSLEQQYAQVQEKNQDLQQKLVNATSYNSLLAEKEKTIAGLIAGQEQLKNVISSMESEAIKLKAIAADSSSDDSLSQKLQSHVTTLQSHLSQREEQLKLYLKQNEELKIELQKMHSKAQEAIGERVSDEEMAHLEAEKEQLHLALGTKTKELKEISNRLLETGQLLQAKTEQLDSFATEIEDARRAKEKSQMTQEAMAKLSHIIRSKDVELEALKAKNDSLMDILRSGDQTAELSSRIESLFEEKSELEIRIRSLNEKINKQGSMLEQAESNLSLLKSDFSDYQTSMSDSEKNFTSLVRQIDNKESEAENEEFSVATLNLLVKKIKEKATLLAANTRGVPDGCAVPNVTMISMDHSHVTGPNGKWTNEQAELMKSSVKNLKERCASLEAKNTVMKRDNDALRDQLMDRREKWDTLELTNQKLGTELAAKDDILGNFKSELNEARAKVKEMSRDVRERDLLRQRLLEVEEEYEVELIRARESEDKLQEQVMALRSGLSDIAGSKNELEEKQQESLRERNQKLDSLKRELNETKKKEKNSEQNVRELQQFIEHFRQQQELSMEERERAHATQLQRAERESTSLRGEIKQIRSRMEAAVHQAAESDQLRVQIRESDSNFARLRCVIDEKAIENDTLRRRLTDAHEQAKKTVDKDLAKNIVLQYLSLPASAKSEGIPILRAVFGFSEVESNQAESASVGWRGWFKTQNPQTTMDPTKSFSELFVDFLETESDQSGGNPAPHLPSFPANKMVAEVGRRGSFGQSDKSKGIEGRNLLNGPMIPTSNKHQNALLQGLLDD